MYGRRDGAPERILFDGFRPIVSDSPCHAGNIAEAGGWLADLCTSASLTKSSEYHPRTTYRRKPMSYEHGQKRQEFMKLDLQWVNYQYSKLTLLTWLALQTPSTFEEKLG